jgi:hypothetical protein
MPSRHAAELLCDGRRLARAEAKKRTAAGSAVATAAERMKQIVYGEVHAFMHPAYAD